MKRCQQCAKDFEPARPLAQVCSALCASRYVRAKAKEKKASERAKLESLKPLRKLLDEAQTHFNRYIRARDEGKPCICCGKPFEPQKPGGSMDAGHFRARSVAPHLRFHEDNVFGQRKNCNRPGGTTYAAFRAGVIARIGEAAVIALEADNRLHKWTRAEVAAIRDLYREKLKRKPE